jgi:hypothetical protein
MNARGMFFLALLGLLPLGCPLLLDDDFVLVEAPDPGAGGVDPTGDAAGAPGVQPPELVTCPAVCDKCDGDVCVFECLGEAACEERTMKCPNGRACQVVCLGRHACAKLRLTCPAASPCTIECGDDKEACKDATVTCGTNRCEARCHDDAESPRLTCGKSVTCVGCE